MKHLLYYKVFENTTELSKQENDKIISKFELLKKDKPSKFELYGHLSSILDSVQI